MELRLPNITAQTAEGQLKQIKSYMYQLVEQLNHTMSANVITQSGETIPVISKGKSTVPQSQEAQDTFNSIKALIIKSAEIVEAYSKEMKTTFDSEYVAQSDFGTFIDNELLTIIANSQGITQLFEAVETLEGEYNALKSSSAWIKSGKLDDDIYGIEVGQTTTLDDVEVFDKFARFTANGIYFYVPGYPDPVAQLTSNGLIVSNARISGSLEIGNYKILPENNGISFRWSGGGS